MQSASDEKLRIWPENRVYTFFANNTYTRKRFNDFTVTKKRIFQLADGEKKMSKIVAKFFYCTTMVDIRVDGGVTFSEF